MQLVKHELDGARDTAERATLGELSGWCEASDVGRLAVLAVIGVAASVACRSNPKFGGLDMGPRHASFQERLVVRDLLNGLRVILLPDARTNLVSVGVNYQVGGADDPPGDSGLAHYVEHVLYDAAFSGAGGPELQDAQLDANASTSFDRTYFYATALDTNLDRVLEAAARRLEVKCDDLNDAALARERDVVIEEMKYRSRFRWNNDALMAALWGKTHPYAHAPGGTDFADASREALCSFVEGHYGPASAVLVVTGNVHDGDMERIRRRFERIRARSGTKHAKAPRLTPATERVTVAGLERPAAMLVFPVPEEGDVHDAAVSILDGMSWPVEGTSTNSARTLVIGEQRARAVIAYAEVEDAKPLPQVETALRSAFKRPHIQGFAKHIERARIDVVAKLDDILLAGYQLTAGARRNQLTRFRELRQLDALTERQALQWFDLSKARVVFLLPEVGIHGAHRLSELTTELHHVEILRAPLSDAGLAIPARPRREVFDYRLKNGVRVLLAPDSESIGFDARLVIATGDGTSSSKIAAQAAWFLEPTNGMTEGWEGYDRVRWYRSIGTSVTPNVGNKATTFQVSGLSLFGDWHVWNLAWTVLHGRYPEWIDERRAGSKSKAKANEKTEKPPTAVLVVLSRLTGIGDRDSSGTFFTTKQLEEYRRSAYRPEVATLIVAGKFEVARLRTEIDLLFGQWRGEGRAPANSSQSVPTPRMSGFVVVPTEDDSTVEIAIGFAPVGTSSGTDRIARAVLDEMLTERLKSIRAGMGVTYGIEVLVNNRVGLVHGHVEPAFAVEAAKAMAAELEHVRNGAPDLKDDFARAKRRVLVRALAEPLGPAKRAEALERIAVERTPVDSGDREVEMIRTLGLEAVRAVAARDLKPERMIAVVRGQASAANAALVALGADSARIQTFVRE